MTEFISQCIDGFLFLSIPLSLIGSLMYFFLPYGFQSRLCFAGFLFVFSLALIRIFLMHIDWLESNPTFYFFPLWYTLSFGVLIFYAVKLRLYPHYRMRRTDAKHFFLPVSQALFYWIIFFQDDNFKITLLENFIPTYYKPLEGVLYIILFFSYILMAYRYIKYKQAVLKKREKIKEVKALEQLERMVKIFFVLGVINTSYIISDFVAWQFFGLNLYTVRGFVSLNDLSFAAMGWWLAFFAYRQRKRIFFFI